MQRDQRESLEASTLRTARRRGVSLAAARPVETEVVAGGETRCLLVRPAGSDVDLVGWAASDPGFFDESLATYGAVVLRGFDLPAVADFERFAQAVTRELFGDYGDLPRAGLGGKVYTSTPYPPEEWILYHNESSHLDRWPLRQLFHCVTPPAAGGETPLADCRRVLARLRPEVRRPFAEHGVMYVRNFTPGFDVPWQEFFHTEDKSEVEAACREAGLAAEWTADGGLRTKKVCPAVARHPTTGEEVFFNQIQAHHVSCLPAAVRESLFSLLDEAALPRNAYYGDGSPIASETMEEIIGVYHQVAYVAPWQKGDVVLLDNMLTAHARAPFSGERKIVVAMGDMVGIEQLGEPAP